MADPTKKLNTVRVNVPMPQTTADMLSKLSHDSKRAKSQIIREGIIALFRMKYANEPRCADSGLCKCPNMHTVQASNRISDEDLLKQQASGSPDTATETSSAVV